MYHHRIVITTTIANILSFILRSKIFQLKAWPERSITYITGVNFRFVSTPLKPCPTGDWWSHCAVKQDRLVPVLDDLVFCRTDYFDIISLGHHLCQALKRKKKRNYQVNTSYGTVLSQWCLTILTLKLLALIYNLYNSRKNPYPPGPWRVIWKFQSRGMGILKGKILEEKYKVQLEFSSVSLRGAKKPCLAWGGVWIFSGTMHAH